MERAGSPHREPKVPLALQDRRDQRGQPVQPGKSVRPGLKDLLVQQGRKARKVLRGRRAQPEQTAKLS
jgi:hypothetical protein